MRLIKTLTKMLGLVLAAVVCMAAMSVMNDGGPGGIMTAVAARPSREKFEKFTGLSGLARGLETIRLRSAHPTWTPEMITAKADENAKSKGVMGVLMTMNKHDSATTVATAAATAAAPNGPTQVAAPHQDSQPAKAAETATPQTPEVYISVAENRDAILQAQTAAGSDADKVKGAVQDRDLGARRVQVQNTQDNREVYGVIHESGPVDLNALDRINKLNIPDDLRNKILRNYQATGVLPEIVVREARKPAAVAPQAPGEVE